MKFADQWNKLSEEKLKKISIKIKKIILDFEEKKISDSKKLKYKKFGL